MRQLLSSFQNCLDDNVTTIPSLSVTDPKKEDIFAEDIIAEDIIAEDIAARSALVALCRTSSPIRIDRRLFHENFERWFADLTEFFVGVNPLEPDPNPASMCQGWRSGPPWTTQSRIRPLCAKGDGLEPENDAEKDKPDAGDPKEVKAEVEEACLSDVFEAPDYRYIAL